MTKLQNKAGLHFLVTFCSMRWYWYFLLHCNKCAMF